MFNLIKGDISLVGRSNILNYPALIEYFPKDEIQILEKIKPGFVSLYSMSLDKVNFNPTDNLKFDIYYLNNRSILLDLKIMFSTFLVAVGLISKY